MRVGGGEIDRRRAVRVAGAAVPEDAAVANRLEYQADIVPLSYAASTR